MTRPDPDTDRLVDQMTLEEKAGQLLVVDFTGITITPHIIRLIEKYHCAGLRVQSDTRIKSIYHSGPLNRDLVKQRSWRDPVGPCKDLAFAQPAPHCSPGQYASVLNRLKEIAMNRRLGIPLHIVFDQEGAGYENYICGRVKLFPTQMGMASIEDQDLVYRGYRAMARQFVLSGLNWIHSPVLDVNTNPDNPEIGIRAFSDDPERVSDYASIMLKAFRAERLVTTGKHFPGRGESTVDAHSDLPVIDLDRDRLWDIHLAPYRRLIAEGLPSVMTAHTIYPALEKEDIPGTVSRSIITGLLREELGFEGAITTDNLLMNGLVKKYEIAEASVLAIKAGATLLLPRAESPLIDEIYHRLVDAMKSGELPVETVEDAIRRNLRVKHEYGLFEDGGIVDPVAADAYQDDPDACATEIAVAEAATLLMRDRKQILPFPADARILLIDQTGGTLTYINNFHHHPGVFWEAFLEMNENVLCVEIDGGKVPDEETSARVRRRVEEADYIVAVNNDMHRKGKFNTALLEELAGTGKPMVVVTNSPYKTSDVFDAVLVLFGSNTAGLKAAAEIILGRRKPMGCMPLKGPLCG